jgi:hypothetical protein
LHVGAELGNRPGARSRSDRRATRRPSRSGRLVERNDGKPFDRRAIRPDLVIVAEGLLALPA